MSWMNWFIFLIATDIAPKPGSGDVRLTRRIRIRAAYRFVLKLRPAGHGVDAGLAVSVIECFGRNPVHTGVVADEPAPVETGPYQIGRDDVIDVLARKQPQLTAGVRVAGDGNVTVPLIGQVVAFGRTASQLQDAPTHRR